MCLLQELVICFKIMEQSIQAHRISIFSQQAIDRAISRDNIQPMNSPAKSEELILPRFTAGYVDSNLRVPTA